MADSGSDDDSHGSCDSQRDEALLWTAAEHGDIARVHELIDSGVNVNSANAYGWAAIHQATCQGEVEIVELLLYHGANVNAKRHYDGHTPLHDACQHWQLEVAKVLLENNANVDAMARHGRTPLYRLCEEHHYRPSLVPMAKLLIENGANVNATEFVYDETPLFRACLNDQLGAAKLLIESGAKVDAKPSNVGYTALHWASTEMSQLLIQNGANVNVRENEHGISPLHNACLYSQFEYEKVELLIDNGADVNAELTSNGKTPLHLACETHFLEAAKLLLSRVADVNAESYELTTPLHLACNENHADIVWLLVRQHPWLVVESLEEEYIA